MKRKALPLVLSFFLLLTAVYPISAYAVSDRTGIDAPLPECFQQADERWADQELIGSNGCGLLSLVNAVNYLTGNFIDPVELAVYAHKIDAYNGSVGGGTARWVLYCQLSRYEKKYGFRVTDSGMDAGVRHPDFIQNLENGGVSVCHVSGHFIAIVDYDADTDRYLVYDSAANLSKRNTTTSPTWLSGDYLSTSAYMTVDWWCLLERTGNSRNVIGSRTRVNQPVEISRHIEPNTPLTLTGAAAASGGIRSLFYVVDYDYDNTVELPDSVTANKNADASFSLSIDLSGLNAGVHVLRLSARGSGTAVSDIAVCTLFVGSGNDGGMDADTGDVTIGFSGYVGMDHVKKKAPVTLGVKISCFKAESDAVLLLGEMDLSAFSYVVVSYSVNEAFNPNAGGVPACIGLKTVAASYGDGNSAYNLDGSLVLASAEGGEEGLQCERKIVLDLSDTDYSGEVYLTACVPAKQHIYIRNLKFCTGKTVETVSDSTQSESSADTSSMSDTCLETAADSLPQTESTKTDTAAGGCTSSYPIAAAFALILPLLGTAALRKRKHERNR